jgi:hypothetical protein
MGGPGSGNRSWKRARPSLVEDAFTLDLRTLLRAGRLLPGAAVTGLWDVHTPVGDRRMMIGYHGDLTSLEDATVTLMFDAGGIDYIQRLNLTVTEPHLGGLRLWFLCPVTGHRARALYLPEGEKQFASREAYGLSYQSQSDSALFRTIAQAQKVRARLGGDLSIHSPFPARPRGMHRRTYERLREAALKIEAAAREALLIWEAAIDSRIAYSTDLCR